MENIFFLYDKENFKIKILFFFGKYFQKGILFIYYLNKHQILIKKNNYIKVYNIINE